MRMTRKQDGFSTDLRGRDEAYRIHVGLNEIESDYY